MTLEARDAVVTADQANQGDDWSLAISTSDGVKRYSSSAAP